MKPSEYQHLANRTTRRDLNSNIRLAVASLGLTGESGEVAEIVKKYLGHSHPLNNVKLKEELGDVMWYIAEFCNIMGWDMGDVMNDNIKKLRTRYPKGFDEVVSRSRYE